MKNKKYNHIYSIFLFYVITFLIIQFFSTLYSQEECEIILNEDTDIETAKKELDIDAKVLLRAELRKLGVPENRIDSIIQNNRQIKNFPKLKALLDDYIRDPIYSRIRGISKYPTSINDLNNVSILEAIKLVQRGHLASEVFLSDIRRQDSYNPEKARTLSEIFKTAEILNKFIPHDHSLLDLDANELKIYDSIIKISHKKVKEITDGIDSNPSINDGNPDNDHEITNEESKMISGINDEIAKRLDFIKKFRLAEKINLRGIDNLQSLEELYVSDLLNLHFETQSELSIINSKLKQHFIGDKKSRFQIDRSELYERYTKNDRFDAIQEKMDQLDNLELLDSNISSLSDEIFTYLKTNKTRARFTDFELKSRYISMEGLEFSKLSKNNQQMLQKKYNHYRKKLTDINDKSTIDLGDATKKLDQFAENYDGNYRILDNTSVGNLYLEIQKVDDFFNSFNDKVYIEYGLKSAMDKFYMKNFGIHVSQDPSADFTLDEIFIAAEKANIKNYQELMSLNPRQISELRGNFFESRIKKIAKSSSSFLSGGAVQAIEQAVIMGISRAINANKDKDENSFVQHISDFTQSTGLITLVQTGRRTIAESLIGGGGTVALKGILKGIPRALGENALFVGWGMLVGAADQAIISSAFGPQGPSNKTELWEKFGIDLLFNGFESCAPTVMGGPEAFALCVGIWFLSEGIIDILDAVSGITPRMKNEARQILDGIYDSIENKFKFPITTNKFTFESSNNGIIDLYRQQTETVCPGGDCLNSYERLIPGKYKRADRIFIYIENTIKTRTEAGEDENNVVKDIINQLYTKALENTQNNLSDHKKIRGELAKKNLLYLYPKDGLAKSSPYEDNLRSKANDLMKKIMKSSIKPKFGLERNLANIYNQKYKKLFRIYDNNPEQISMIDIFRNFLSEIGAPSIAVKPDEALCGSGDNKYMIVNPRNLSLKVRTNLKPRDIESIVFSLYSQIENGKGLQVYKGSYKNNNTHSSLFSILKNDGKLYSFEEFKEKFYKNITAFYSPIGIKTLRQTFDFPENVLRFLQYISDFKDNDNMNKLFIPKWYKNVELKRPCMYN